MTELEEDEEIMADKHTHTHNSDSLSQPVPSGYELGENVIPVQIILKMCRCAVSHYILEAAVTKAVVYLCLNV